MKKRQLICALLALAMLLAAVPGMSISSAAAGQPETGTAYPSTQNVDVDGETVEFQMYALLDANGYQTNYIKARDLAFILKDTVAQFEVGWSGKVSFMPGETYTPNGSEMKTPFTGEWKYERSSAPTVVGGEETDLDAIILKDSNGGGYTYYQLKELGKTLDFNVYWNAEKGMICVETDQPYTGKATPKKPMSEDFDPATNQKVEIDGYAFFVPKSWTVAEPEEGGIMAVKNEMDAAALAMNVNVGYDLDKLDQTMQELVLGMTMDGVEEMLREYDMKWEYESIGAQELGDVKAYLYSLDASLAEVDFSGNIMFFWEGSELYFIIAVQQKDAPLDYSADLMSVLLSVQKADAPAN